MRSVRSAAALIGALLVGCAAPAQSLRPVTPFEPGQRVEIGLGGGGGDAGLSDRQGDFYTSYGSRAGGDATIWGYGRWRDVLDVGALAFAGNTGFYGGGLSLRYVPVSNDSLGFAVRLEGGYAWVDVAVDFSFALDIDLWFYVSPSLGARDTATLRIPIGLAFLVTRMVGLQLEFVYGADPLTDATVDLVYGSIGLTWRL